jgi:twitching motility protein PilT
MEITHILSDIVSKNASDIFIVAGRPLSIKINNVIVNEDDTCLTPDMTKAYIAAIYRLANGRSMENVLRGRRRRFLFCDQGPFAFPRQRLQAARVAFRRYPRHSVQAAGPGKIHIPQAVMRLADYQKGWCS